MERKHCRRKGMKETPVPIKSDALAHDVDPLKVGEVGVLGDDLGHDLQAVVRTVLRGKQEINLVRTQSNILQTTHSCQQLERWGLWTHKSEALKSQ
jgi:hypothetical protein